MDNSNPEKVSKDEVLECLLRSGYVMESRIVRSLSQAGFFVDPNQMIKDDLTGKSREIDILAERPSFEYSKFKLCVKTHFVIEAINNLYPLVLLTERPFSPNSIPDEYLKFFVTPDEHPFPWVFICDEKAPLGTVYSQYCVISKKKHSELMASHSDDLYSSINKAVRYCVNAVSIRENWDLSDDYWRLFFWRPVLVVQNDLLVLHSDVDGGLDLEEVKFAQLEYNFYLDESPDSILVDVVSEEYMLDHLLKVTMGDRAIEGKLVELRGGG